MEIFNEKDNIDFPSPVVPKNKKSYKIFFIVILAWIVIALASIIITNMIINANPGAAKDSCGLNPNSEVEIFTYNCITYESPEGKQFTETVLTNLPNVAAWYASAPPGYLFNYGVHACDDRDKGLTYEQMVIRTTLRMDSKVTVTQSDAEFIVNTALETICK